MNNTDQPDWRKPFVVKVCLKNTCTVVVSIDDPRFQYRKEHFLPDNLMFDQTWADDAARACILHINQCQAWKGIWMPDGNMLCFHIRDEEEFWTV